MKADLSSQGLAGVTFIHRTNVSVNIEQSYVQQSEVSQRTDYLTSNTADWTQCAIVNDRALAKQTRSTMRAAKEVSIHASRLLLSEEIVMSLCSN